jgi:hypothetical protein
MGYLQVFIHAVAILCVVYYLCEQIASFYLKEVVLILFSRIFQTVKSHGPIRSGTDILPLVRLLVYELHSFSY